VLNGIELQGAQPSVLKLVLMEAKIVFTALILGLVFGSLMLCSSLFVYIKHKTFGLGGAVLTVFGVILLGLSIWKTVEVSVKLEGEIEAKFEALEKRVEDVREIADSTTAKVEEIDKAQNLVIREIMNVQSSMYKIEDHIEYLEVTGGSAAEPPKDLSIRE
jgi:hypothetical protein